jgi:hypothetical protein
VIWEIFISGANPKIFDYNASVVVGKRVFKSEKKIF